MIDTCKVHAFWRPKSLVNGVIFFLAAKILNDKLQNDPLTCDQNLLDWLIGD